MFRTFHSRAALLATVAGIALWPAVASAQDEEVGPPASPVIGEEMDSLHFVVSMEANLRAAPSGDAETLERLAFGEMVFVTGRVHGVNWLRVESGDGVVGYMWGPNLTPMVIALPGTAAPGQAAAPFEPDDDTLATAIPLDASLGFAAASGRVGPDDELDYYVFSIDGWSDIEVRAEGLSADADLSLLDGNGNVLAESVFAGTDPEEIYYLADAGTYYIQVYMFEGETGYDLTLATYPAEPPPADLAGETFDSALDMGVATPGQISQDEWIGAGDSLDYLRFEVAERSLVMVTMDGMQADADLALEDDFGSILSSSAEGGSYAEYIEIVLDPGVYYLSVTPFSGSTPYVVTVATEPSGPAPDDNAGNSTASARDLGLLQGDIEAADWIGLSDPDDYYRFTVDAPIRLVLRLDDMVADADVELLTDGGQFLADSIAAGTEPEQIDTTLDPGTYYVHVYSFAGSTDYRLSLSAQ